MVDIKTVKRLLDSHYTAAQNSAHASREGIESDVIRFNREAEQIENAILSWFSNSRADFEAALKTTNKRHGGALKKLADQ